MMFATENTKDLMDPGITSLLISLEGKMRRVRREVRYQLDTLATVPNTLPLQKIVTSYSKLSAICGKIAGGISEWHSDLERYILLIKKNELIKSGHYTKQGFTILDPKNLCAMHSSDIETLMSRAKCNSRGKPYKICRLICDPCPEIEQ